MKKLGEPGYLREWCIENGLPPELGEAGEADLDRRDREFKAAFEELQRFCDELAAREEGEKSVRSCMKLKVKSKKRLAKAIRAKSSRSSARR